MQCCRLDSFSVRSFNIVQERLRRQLSELLDAQQQLATSQHHQQQQQHQQSFAQQRLQQLDTQQHKVENHQQLPQQQQASRSQQQVLMPSVLLPRPLCAPSQPLTQPLQGGAAAGMPRPAATGPKATTGPLRPHLVAKFLKLLKSQMQQESLVSPGLPRAYAQLSGVTCHPCLMTHLPVSFALSVVRTAVVYIATWSILAALSRLF